MSVLTTRVKDGTLTAVLDRPDNLNAITEAMMSELRAAVREAEDREDVRCLLVTGAGEAFCAGGDIQAMEERFGTVDAPKQRSYMRTGPQAAIGDLFTADIPTVAKVDGPAVGAGMGVALACDVVLATESSTFGAPFVDLGLVADGGLTFLLPALVGFRRAVEIVYRGNLYNGTEAAEMGLITDAMPARDLDERCANLLTELASGPTQAYSLAKEALQFGATHDMRAALDNEANLQAIAIETTDHEEGVRAFLEDRDPSFAGE